MCVFPLSLLAFYLLFSLLARPLSIWEKVTTSHMSFEFSFESLIWLLCVSSYSKLSPVVNPGGETPPRSKGAGDSDYMKGASFFLFKSSPDRLVTGVTPVPESRSAYPVAVCPASKRTGQALCP